MSKKKIVIVGGGFAGVEFVKTLGNSEKYDIVLVDVNNYNFFPPLIYQVSTGFMEPSAISYPFRKILRSKKSVRFRLGELQKVNPEENKIILNNGELSYDILVMATGTESNFFGNKNIEENSLPMKTISDALALRNEFLTRLDKATRLKTSKERKKLLTFVIAGAGPTGIEISGILSEMKTSVVKDDYPELCEEDLGDVYLVEGGGVVLSPMSKKSQDYTYTKLLALGVIIKLNTLVKDYDGSTVSLSDGTTIEAGNLVWTAGVKAKTFEGFAEESFGAGKRLKTNAYNLVEGYENIYALGDCALVAGDENFPKGHPQLAQPAIQQGKNLAKNLNQEKSRWKPFSYFDKGSLAIIGRNKAVMDFPKQKGSLTGFIAWFIWIFVHLMSLVNFKNRLHTFINWIGYYIYKDQDFRMIIKPRKSKKEEEESS